MCMEQRRRFSQTMASEWHTAFVVSHKMPWFALLTAVKYYNKSLYCPIWIFIRHFKKPLVKSKWSSIQLYIHISKDSTLHVRGHVLEFLFVYLFFFLIMTSLWHYCSILFDALLIPFSYEDKRSTQHWTTHNWCIHWSVVFTTENMHMCQWRTF